MQIKERWVVILCGGRGSRLAPITNTIPKSLIKIHEKPILWYVFLTLFKYGFRKFIFPLGYKGEMIEEFTTREFKDRECMTRSELSGNLSLIFKEKEVEILLKCIVKMGLFLRNEQMCWLDLQLH